MTRRNFCISHPPFKPCGAFGKCVNNTEGYLFCECNFGFSGGDFEELLLSDEERFMGAHSCNINRDVIVWSSVIGTPGLVAGTVFFVWSISKYGLVNLERFGAALTCLFGTVTNIECILGASFVKSPFPIFFGLTLASYLLTSQMLLDRFICMLLASAGVKDGKIYFYLHRLQKYIIFSFPLDFLMINIMAIPAVANISQLSSLICIKISYLYLGMKQVIISMFIWLIVRQFEIVLLESMYITGSAMFSSKIPQKTLGKIYREVRMFRMGSIIFLLFTAFIFSVGTLLWDALFIQIQTLIASSAVFVPFMILPTIRFKVKGTRNSKILSSPAWTSEQNMIVK